MLRPSEFSGIYAWESELRIDAILIQHYVGWGEEISQGTSSEFLPKWGARITGEGSVCISTHILILESFLWGFWITIAFFILRISQSFVKFPWDVCTDCICKTTYTWAPIHHSWHPWDVSIIGLIKANDNLPLQNRYPQMVCARWHAHSERCFRKAPEGEGRPNNAGSNCGIN